MFPEDGSDTAKVIMTIWVDKWHFIPAQVQSPWTSWLLTTDSGKVRNRFTILKFGKKNLTAEYWDGCLLVIATCNVLEINRRFREPWFALMMETAMALNLYQTPRRYDTEDSHLGTCLCTAKQFFKPKINA